jgi:hypothetical protein
MASTGGRQALVVAAAWLRMSEPTMSLVRSAALLVSVLTLPACPGGGNQLPSDSKQLERLRSPDGKVDAVLYLTPTDPLSSDVQTVRLEPVGAKGEWHGIVARARYAQGPLGMRWLSDTLLEITYRGGHVYDFDNEWWTYQVSPKNSLRMVELLLRKQPQ